VLGLVEALSDCHGVVATRIGESPKGLFAKKGILCKASHGSVEGAVLGFALELAANAASPAPALAMP
jgi:hypothetical protein